LGSLLDFTFGISELVRSTMIVALVDDREPKEIHKNLGQYFKVQSAHLETGDILIPGEDRVFVVERKTPQDFLHSIADNRLSEQVAKMLVICNQPVIIIEGDIKCNKNGKVVADGRHTKWNYWSMQGAILSTQLAGVMVIQVPSRLFAESVYRTLQWSQKKEHLAASQRRVSMELRTTFGQQVDFLATLPNIGPEKAEQLLSTFGNPWGVLSSLPDWIRVKGIGKKTIEVVTKFLDFDKEKL